MKNFEKNFPVTYIAITSGIENRTNMKLLDKAESSNLVFLNVKFSFPNSILQNEQKFLKILKIFEKFENCLRVLYIAISSRIENWRKYEVIGFSLNYALSFFLASPIHSQTAFCRKNKN